MVEAKLGGKFLESKREIFLDKGLFHLIPFFHCDIEMEIDFFNNCD